MRNEIYYVVTAKVKPGKFADFKQVVAPLVAATAQEPGSNAYDYSVDDQQSVVHIVESYRDSQAVIDHITGTFAPFADDFGSCVDIESFVVYGHPDNSARVVLDGFGSKYMIPFEGFTANSP